MSKPITDRLPCGHTRNQLVPDDKGAESCRACASDRLPEDQAEELAKYDIPFWVAGVRLPVNEIIRECAAELRKVRGERNQAVRRRDQWRALLKSSERRGKENHFLRAERDRYRAALERIRSYKLKYRPDDPKERDWIMVQAIADDAIEPKEIARAALAGGSDEAT